MAIYSGFSHWKWWFSIAMLVYQRVITLKSQKPLLKIDPDADQPCQDDFALVLMEDNEGETLFLTEELPRDHHFQVRNKFSWDLQQKMP